MWYNYYLIKSQNLYFQHKFFICRFFNHFSGTLVNKTLIIVLCYTNIRIVEGYFRLQLNPYTHFVRGGSKVNFMVWLKQ